LSLAKVIGPESVLDQKIFTVIRKEAEKTKMPLYQTVVSYVQKMKLGGKSYVPSSDHPFMPFNKDLTEFTNLMSKLYSKLEDEMDSENAFKKVMTCLKSHISKSSTLKISSVEKVIEKMLDQFSICLKRFQTYEKQEEDEEEKEDANGSSYVIVGSEGGMDVVMYDELCVELSLEIDVVST
jgi:cysteinyl-tRNA synthetase